MAMGEILSELDRIVSDEAEAEASAELASKEVEKEPSVDDIIKHIDNVEAAADFVDAMTPGEKGDVAFDAEVALRKALVKMRDLSEDVYKDAKTNDDDQTEEV